MPTLLTLTTSNNKKPMPNPVKVTLEKGRQTVGGDLEKQGVSGVVKNAVSLFTIQGTITTIGMGVVES